ncbi:MAG: hypothetical protein SGI74_00750 [Oligoflexia bacterium]|nr:hypothetical protein [Oligoflexia bacterium]
MKRFLGNLENSKRHFYRGLSFLCLTVTFVLFQNFSWSTNKIKLDVSSFRNMATGNIEISIDTKQAASPYTYGMPNVPIYISKYALLMHLKL